RAPFDPRLRRNAAGLEVGNGRHSQPGLGPRTGRPGSPVGITLLRLDAFAGSRKGVSLASGDGMRRSPRSQRIDFWVCVVSLAGLIAADSHPLRRTFVGTITDTECGADHRPMIGRGGMGSTTASCTRGCVSKGATYGFVDRKRRLYQVDDQEKPASFAGKKVRVTGRLE